MMFLSQQKRKEPCVAGTRGLGLFPLDQFYFVLFILLSALYFDTHTLRSRYSTCFSHGLDIPHSV